MSSMLYFIIQFSIDLQAAS